MQGVPTDEETIAKFRAAYLYSGNASKCARDLNLPERTGRWIAEWLSEQPDFAEDRRKLRARALEELIAMRTRVAETAAERFEDDLFIPEVGEGSNVTIIDKRPDYAKVVLEAEKNAHNLAKIEIEQRNPERQPVEVHVHLKPDDEPPDAG